MSRLRGWFVAGLILLGCVGVAGFMVSLKPEPARKPPPSRIPFAATAAVLAGSGAIPVSGAGTVRPSAEIDVSAEISGKVAWVEPAFQSGGRVHAGQALFRIDAADYRNSVEQARANVAAQQVAVLQADEETRIARSEYAQFQRRQADSASSTEASPLTLREPQLEAARAALVRAQAGLADAELALSRTQVHAPFNGVVRAESVDVGQFVSAGQSVGRLYAADTVEVVVPLADADAALLPGLWELEAGDENERIAARVIAAYGDSRYAWAGYVDRVEAALDDQTRTIHVIVRVPDPFSAGMKTGADADQTALPDTPADAGPPLLVGKFVAVHMQGLTPDQYFILPRSALRPGNEVWAVRENTVTIVPVRVLQRADDDVYVTGALAAGQAVIVGGIQFATEGMVVRTEAGEEA